MRHFLLWMDVLFWTMDNKAWMSQDVFKYNSDSVLISSMNLFAVTKTRR